VPGFATRQPFSASVAGHHKPKGEIMTKYSKQQNIDFIKDTAKSVAEITLTDEQAETAYQSFRERGKLESEDFYYDLKEYFSGAVAIDED
jgi:hypothetical protein